MNISSMYYVNYVINYSASFSFLNPYVFSSSFEHKCIWYNLKAFYTIDSYATSNLMLQTVHKVIMNINPYELSSLVQIYWRDLIALNYEQI